MHIPQFSAVPEVLPLGLQWKTSGSFMQWFWSYTQEIGQKTDQMRSLAGKPVLMEKNFKIAICSRTCCQCWGQKNFNLTTHGHPIEHRLSHLAGSSGNFSCELPVPRGEALARLQCSVASSYGLQLECAIWPQTPQLTDVQSTSSTEHKSALHTQLCLSPSLPLPFTVPGVKNCSYSPWLSGGTVQTITGKCAV